MIEEELLRPKKQLILESYTVERSMLDIWGAMLRVCYEEDDLNNYLRNEKGDIKWLPIKTIYFKELMNEIHMVHGSLSNQK